MGAGLLLNDIIVRMKDVIMPSPKQMNRIQAKMYIKTHYKKFVLFSAHDGTILALMSAMGVKDFGKKYINHFITLLLW